jgi:hypothetical protein
MHASQILAFAERATGLPYVMGAEADLNSDDLPPAFDCSELVQWACVRNGIDCPDGHWIQVEWCAHNETLCSIEQAIATPGALLFVYDGTPVGHVAFSRGDGTTMEARGAAWGCGSWSVENRGWTRAALIPGVDYTPPEADMTLQELAHSFGPKAVLGVDGVIRIPLATDAAILDPEHHAGETELHPVGDVWTFTHQEMKTKRLRG